MEFANVWSEQAATPKWVRQATMADAEEIRALLDRGRYQHVHVDWFTPIDWLGHSGFMVHKGIENRSRFSFAGKMFGDSQALAGCLAVTAEPMPAAWVRIAAIGDRYEPERVFVRLFEAVVAHLRQTAVSSLMWLMVAPWPESWLSGVGLAPVSAIETYIKEDLGPQELVAVPDLLIRAAQPTDFEALAAMEVAAFAPMWRHSVAGLKMAYKKAFRFDVMVLADEVVGFQVSTRSGYTAHLARMTIAPARQGCGLGRALLTYILREYRRAGITAVSLNTQLDNVASKGLYSKFGFVATGEEIPIWGMTLSEHLGYDIA